MISQLRSELGSNLPIIGVGGITTADSALATLKAGADVIPLYTGLIYRGPMLLNEILEAISQARAALQPVAAHEVGRHESPGSTAGVEHG